mmetsp:Transcript_684/g.741  ORF Transcript_684/g.741 Transcript_684/m.741 type:complete len:98 (+) Transcript_684:191-484(+)
MQRKCQNGSSRIASFSTHPPSPLHLLCDVSTNHVSKVEEESSSRRNITREKIQLSIPGNHYDEKRKKQRSPNFLLGDRFWRHAPCCNGLNRRPCHFV